MKSCFFIGHRDVPSAVEPALMEEVSRHITECHVTNFFVGSYGGFDSMAAGAVKKMKQAHPEITLQLLLPYHPAERPVPVPDGFDGTYYPFERAVPYRLAITKANRMMIDTCDFLIAYAAHPGNARTFWEYAQARQKKGLLTATNLFSKQNFI